MRMREDAHWPILRAACSCLLLNGAQVRCSASRVGEQGKEPADDEAGLPHLRITAPAPAVADQGEQQAVVHGEFVTVPLLVLLHAVLVATQKLGIIQREGERSQGK